MIFLLLDVWPATTILLAALCLWIYLRGREELREAEERSASSALELSKSKELQDETIRQIRTRQNAIFNSMVEGILLLDQNGRVHSVNKSFERLFSVDRDLLGMRLIEAVNSPELLEIAEITREEGVVKGFELKLPATNRYLEVNAAAIQRAGSEPEGLIIIFHDFTRIKELENLRREFVANVSHELRTPLTLIKGYVETLLDGAREDPAICSKFLLTIQKHSNRLAFLIEDLLTLSQLESGAVIMHPQPTSIREIVERVLEELGSRAADKKIELVDNVPQDFELNVDADRLQQVFFNLIDNAIKYGNENGTVEIGAKLDSAHATLYVRDNGPGIPPDSKARVFERFYRVDRARSREAGGTGLGLAIVKHIVQSHGGSVWVESQLNKGSTFYFTLPNSAPSCSP
ncbi:MAG: sensor histidine kinase [Verrucomicrobiota bacterium]